MLEKKEMSDVEFENEGIQEGCKQKVNCGKWNLSHRTLAQFGILDDQSWQVLAMLYLNLTSLYICFWRKLYSVLPHHLLRLSICCWGISLILTWKGWQHTSWKSWKWSCYWMAKSKKQQISIPNKNIHLRLSFLHKAATYLAILDEPKATEDGKSKSKEEGAESFESPSTSVTTRSSYLINHMKGVGRKSVIRLSQDVKRSTCKGCDQLLISEETTSVTIENKSKNQRKACANVRVVRCRRCGMSKRYPCPSTSDNSTGGKIEGKVPGIASDNYQESSSKVSRSDIQAVNGFGNVDAQNLSLLALMDET